MKRRPVQGRGGQGGYHPPGPPLCVVLTPKFASSEAYPEAVEASETQPAYILVSYGLSDSLVKACRSLVNSCKYLTLNSQNS